MATRHNTSRPSRRRGFSMVELLVALTISATLLAATLSALDASWRSYKHTTESASTHVVARIVVTRVLTMIRTGESFRPYPADYFDPNQNPVVASYIEFIEKGNDETTITRIERRQPDEAVDEYELWYVQLDATTTPETVTVERKLMDGIRECLFIMEYEPGPVLQQATMDLSISPNDAQYMNEVALDIEAPLIRFVASASPRSLE